MDALLIILLTILVVVAILAASGIFAERVASLLRRLRPGLEYDEARLMLKGLLLLVAFVLGLLVMYLALAAS